jgi:hypothetical protein
MSDLFTCLGIRNWREPPERDSEARAGRLRRGSDSLHHDRGDHMRGDHSRKKTFDRNYGSDEDDPGN